MEDAAPLILTRIKMDMTFWNAFPANRFQCIHLAGCQQTFNQCSMDELSVFLGCLSTKTPRLDLSNTGFATQQCYKKRSTLKKVFANVSPNTMTHLDLSDNGYTAKQQKRLLGILPHSVTHAAFHNHVYHLKMAYQQTKPVNYSFLLKMFMGLAAIGGAALLLVGFLAVNPILVGAGLGLVTTAVVAGMVHRGLFHHKPKKVNVPLTMPLDPTEVACNVQPEGNTTISF